jgi:hypothetical protein
MFAFSVHSTFPTNPTLLDFIISTISKKKTIALPKIQEGIHQMNSSYRQINYKKTGHSLLPIHTEYKHNIVFVSTSRKILGDEK